MIASFFNLCIPSCFIRLIIVQEVLSNILNFWLQGRLFLSARIVGFYSNLFGHKTKFFFLWEDIENIQVLPPSLSSVGSPILVIILKKDRGLDARHGAKSQDEEGKLRFCFQHFVSFNVAIRYIFLKQICLLMAEIYNICRLIRELNLDCIGRTIMALWRTRTLTGPDQKAQIVEEEEDQEERSLMVEDTEFVLEAEDAKLSEVYAAELPINVSDQEPICTLFLFQASKSLYIAINT